MTRDLRAMEADLATTDDLGWAVVRPPQLTERPADRRVRSAWDVPLRRTRSISHHALAETLLAVATAEPFRGGVLTVSY